MRLCVNVHHINEVSVREHERFSTLDIGGDEGQVVIFFNNFEEVAKLLIAVDKIARAMAQILVTNVR